jgi:hypothetical protein
LLLDRFNANTTFTIDLAEFERAFIAGHHPIETTFLALCYDCHGKYDRQVRPERGSRVTNPDSYLPINLVPPKPNEFKREFLRTRTAEIVITYSDGRVETKIWNAQKFDASSNVTGNVRSRPEFRNGNWQARGIREVTVRVVK